jgi:Heparinase II/III-like protein
MRVLSFFLVIAQAISASISLDSAQRTVAAPPSLGPHPRLILTADRLASIKSYISSNEDASQFYSLLLKHADWLVTQPTIPEPPSGPSGVLDQVRDIMDIVLSTALAYLLSGNSTYFSRSKLELMNLAVEWNDWNAANHYLDTGEAMTTVSLAYDWLYSDLTTEERASIVNGTFYKGFQPYVAGYANHTFFWFNNTINWNCVCAGGGIIGVLAMLDEPSIPASLYDSVYTPSLESIPMCVSAYAPEGSWEEGVAYWSYASKYTLFAINSMQTALGSSPLADIPGVLPGGNFPLYMLGASGFYFDWADSGNKFFSAFMPWWGLTYNNMAATYLGKEYSLLYGNSSVRSLQWASYAENLMYYVPGGTFSDLASLPLAHLYAERGLVSVRNEWNGFEGSATASSLLVKGGNNAWNHAHLDLTTFVFDFHGKRYITDLGPDSYALPGYFDPTERWTYYRLNSHGHNVLRFDNISQSTTATGNITLSTDSLHKSMQAGVDASVAVTVNDPFPGVNQLTRQLTTSNNVSTITLLDFLTGVTAGKFSNLTLSFHTFANVTVSGDEQVATLSGLLPGDAITLSILPASAGTKCPGLGFKASSVALQKPQNPTTGLMRVDAVTYFPDTCTILGVQIDGNGAAKEDLASFVKELVAKQLTDLSL